jgi:hypothetical protein
MKFSIPSVSSTCPPKRSAAIAGAEALARGVDRRRRARGPAADDQHVERLLSAELLGRLRAALAVEPGQQLLDAHLAAGEHSPLRNVAGTAITLRAVDLVLERAALDQRRGDARIVQRQQRQRLHHVGAVVARQREVHLEREIAVELADLLEHLVGTLGG